MKPPRLKLGSILFGILVLALDFALVRTALTANSPETPGVYALLLLPMIDAILIVLYRLRRPHGRTPRAVGFVLGGSIATTALFLGFVAWPQGMLDLLRILVRPIAMGTVNRLTAWLGNATMQSWPMELALGIGFELVVPLVFYSLPALMVALGSGSLAQRLGPEKTTVPV